MTSPDTPLDLNNVIRDHALALVDKIEDTNKAVRKTGGHSSEVGRNAAFAAALSMLLIRLRCAGANLCEMGLCGIDPVALVEGSPREADKPAPARRSHNFRRRR